MKINLKKILKVVVAVAGVIVTIAPLVGNVVKQAKDDKQVGD